MNYVFSEYDPLQTLTPDPPCTTFSCCCFFLQILLLNTCEQTVLGQLSSDFIAGDHRPRVHVHLYGVCVRACVRDTAIPCHIGSGEAETK